MNKLKAKILYGILRSITLIEMTMNRIFVLIRARILKTSSTNLTVPNDPNGWEKFYFAKMSPVKKVKSEITRHILGLTKQGESLLETGCGSGVLSAELALSGRNISICDFSQPILNQVALLFKISGLRCSGVFHVDITKKLPFQDNQFDVVWNSGVLEHWTDEELKPIICELARCSKRCVITLVPNERSVFYRYGRESSECYGIAPWGREIPRSSLRILFESAGLVNVEEFSVCASDAPSLIGTIDPVFQEKIWSWWNQIPEEDPVKAGQGYLLLTIGYKNTSVI